MKETIKVLIWEYLGPGGSPPLGGGLPRPLALQSLLLRFGIQPLLVIASQQGFT